MVSIKKSWVATIMACTFPHHAMATPCTAAKCQPDIPITFCVPMQNAYCATKECQVAVKAQQGVGTACDKAKTAILQTTPLLGQLDPKNFVYYRGVLTQYWNFVREQISSPQPAAAVIVLHTGKSKTVVGSEPLGGDGFGGMGDYDQGPEAPRYLPNLDFEHGSAEISGIFYLGEVLGRVKTALAENQEAVDAPLGASPVINTIRIEGHFDPTEPKKLAKKRAKAIRDYLVQNGVDAKWLKTAIYTKKDWRIAAVVVSVTPRLVKPPKKKLDLLR